MSDSSSSTRPIRVVKVRWVPLAGLMERIRLQLGWP